MFPLDQNNINDEYCLENFLYFKEVIKSYIIKSNVNFSYDFNSEESKQNIKEVCSKLKGVNTQDEMYLAINSYIDSLPLSENIKNILISFKTIQEKTEFIHNEIAKINIINVKINKINYKQSLQNQRVLSDEYENIFPKVKAYKEKLSQLDELMVAIKDSKKLIDIYNKYPEGISVFAFKDLIKNRITELGKDLSDARKVAFDKISNYYVGLNENILKQRMCETAEIC